MCDEDMRRPVLDSVSIFPVVKHLGMVKYLTELKESPDLTRGKSWWLRGYTVDLNNKTET